MATTEAIDPIERAKAGDAEARREAAGANAREVNRPYDKFRNGIKYGLIAGVIVGIYQFFLNAAEDGINIGLGIVGFVLMTPVIWYALRDLKAHIAGGEFYKNAAILSMYLAFFAAITTVVIGVIGYAVGTGNAPEVASVEGISPFQLAVNSVFQVFVGVVIGNTIAFIFMQGMKTDITADEFVEKND